MIKKLLFVHGTGVRKAAYEHTAAQIASRLKGSVALEPCLWGDLLGATLQLKGASIPDFSGPSAAVPSDDHEVALWELLDRDPLFELRELASTPPLQTFVPPVEQERKRQFTAKVRALKADPAIATLLKGCVPITWWTDATESVARSDPLAAAIAATAKVDTPLRVATVRAVVATTLQHLMADNFPTPTRELRDRIVEQAINMLGGRELGLRDWITNRLVGFGLHWATAKACRNRDALFNAAYPAAGDILLYQARGENIRRFIEQRIQDCGDGLGIIAHSLGGIACVDLLVEQPLPQVKLLVTVGSQAGFLYEIGALTSLPFPKPLPAHFPGQWLNFFDRNDLLSYYAGKVFEGRALDYEVKSGQPFPQSHSAYWGDDELWEKLTPRLR